MRFHALVARLIATLVIIIGTPSASASDVADSFEVTRSGFVRNLQGNTYDLTVTVRNVSPAAVRTPIKIVVGALPKEVGLVNAAGIDGDEYFVTVDVPGNRIDPGAAVGPVILRFENPGRVAIAPRISVRGTAP
jgi:hypothetical protein